MTFLRIFVFIISVFLGGTAYFSICLAQETGVKAEDIYIEKEGWQMGVSTGPFLPNKISRVKEILPFWGISVSKDISVFRPEFTLLQGHGKGHDWYSAMFSFRNELPLYGLEFFWSWGVQLSYYTELLYDVLPTDFVSQGGLHGSIGGMWPVNESWRFRSDIVFFMGPGKALYVGLGLQKSF